MQTVWVFIAAFFALGAVGTALANRGKPLAVQRQRWLKVSMHLLIVVALAWSIQDAPAVLRALTLLIFAGGAWELVRVARQKPQRPGYYLVPALLGAWVVFGFWQMVTQCEPALCLYVFLTVFTFDGFSQIAGQLVGKRPLFPTTSPNKTVEGLAGGAAFALATAWFTRDWVSLDTGQSLLAGLVLGAAALAGDYLASAYKRRHGVKDYSALLPGHGGVLDRFDSWLMAGSVAGWGWVCFLKKFQISELPCTSLFVAPINGGGGR